MTLTDLKLCMAYPRMTVRMLAVMFVLRHDPDTRILRHLAEELDIPKPAISRAFDALCEMKFIKRVRGENDARDVYAVLTDKGREFVERISP